MSTSSNAMPSAWQAYDKRGKPLSCHGWEVNFDGVGAVQYQPVLAGHSVVAFAVARSPNPFAALSTDHVRQIAAAPDLLAAAQALAARGFFTPTSCADAATLEDMAAMRAAIAKATQSEHAGPLECAARGQEECLHYGACFEAGSCVRARATGSES